MHEHGKHQQAIPSNGNVKQSPSVRDPVCGMTIYPARAAGHFDHAGLTYYFCSTHCVERFKADPSRFVAPESAPTDPAQPPTDPSPLKEWTCPMHPQILRNAPGSCPICGMALEPRLMTATEEVNPELV